MSALFLAAPRLRAAPALSVDARVRELVRTHFDLVWRFLRRLGVPEASVDDASQEVWLTVSRRLDEIEREKERSFLFGVAMRVAANTRRVIARRREETADDLEALDPSPSPEESLRRHRARALVDEILDTMTVELRAAFVLFEVEELSATEVAKMLGVPVGTVASRVRRARAQFRASAKRLHTRALLDGAHVSG